MKSSKIGGDDEQQLRTALEITVVGMLRLVRTCLPHLSAAKGNRITIRRTFIYLQCLILLFLLGHNM